MTVEQQNKIELNEGRYKELLLRWVNFTGDDDRLPEDEDFAELINACPEIFRDAVGISLAGSDREWILGVRLNLRTAWSAPDPLTRDWYIFKARDRYARAVRAYRLKNQSPPRKMPNPNFDVPGRTLEEDFKALSRAMDAGQASSLVDASPEWRKWWRANAALRVQLGEAMEGLRRDSAVFIESPPPDTLFDRLLTYFLRHGIRALRCARPGCRSRYFFKADGVKTQTYCENCRAPATNDRFLRYWRRTGKNKRDERLKRVESKGNRRRPAKKKTKSRKEA